MKSLLLICGLLFSTSLWSLNIDIQAAIEHTRYDPYELPKEKKLFQIIEYNEPPTKAQYRAFYILHALDVITTYEGLKSDPNVKEANFLFYNNRRPSLGELVAFKSVMLPFIGNNINSEAMEISNIITAYAIINNYEIYN
tara:strand:- start:524 stop:943 length:420 start_codon:yes stop_codon:yes gene_type:complete